MSRGRHRDLTELFKDIEDSLKSQGSMTTRELKKHLWDEKGYDTKYSTKDSLHRTLLYKREEVEKNTSVKTYKSDTGTGSMLPWKWGIKKNE